MASSVNMNISVTFLEKDLLFSFENDTISVNQNFPYTPFNLVIFITNMMVVAVVNVFVLIWIFSKVPKNHHVIIKQDQKSIDLALETNKKKQKKQKKQKKKEKRKE